MKDGVSCIETPFEFFEDDGSVRTYAQIRYGDEDEDWGGKSGRDCHDCHCKPGDFHHIGCDVERCPRCGGQAINCDCDLAVSTVGSDTQTLLFYKKEARAYAARSDSIGVSKSLTTFTAKLPAHASVLDLGCGTGRDTRALIDAGLAVTAVDGSAEMAREAEKRIGAPVRVLLFEDLDYTQTFDGIWANASLLHVPRAGLANVLARVHRALKPNGLLFASFKSGGTEGRDTLGRYYNYLSQNELEALLRTAGRWSTLEFAHGRGKGFDEAEVDFVSVWARKS